MYGHIHVILKDLVLSVAGEEVWEKILAEAGIKDEHTCLDLVVQSDDVTFALVGATCKVLNLTLDQALRVYGGHFAKFALSSGNSSFLKSQGSTFPIFLANVNGIHNYLERDHPNARFPVIESIYNPEDDSCDVIYLSSRQGCSPLVEGVLSEIGARLYGLEVSWESHEVTQDLQDAASDNRCASWRVTWKPRVDGPKLDNPEEVLQPASPAAASKATEMSFFSWHQSLIHLMRFALACPRGAMPCCLKQKQMIPKIDADKTPKVDTPHSSSGSFAEDAAMEMMVSHRSTTEKLKQVERRGDTPLEDVLLRAAKARHVAAAWSDSTLPKIREFWNNANGKAEHYDLSEDVTWIDVFVSHAWSPPENWSMVMGPDVNYADVKSAAVAVMAKDIALMRNDLSSWQQVKTWVDKACIPQDHSGLKEDCIKNIENFIRRSDHVCVLFTWSYMERLWCVFEWACVLSEISLDRLWLQTDSFINERSLDLYLESVRYFSIKRCKCFLESDRDFLTKKIECTWKSNKAFEDMVKATAVALVARSMAFRAGRSVRLHNTFYMPWVALADHLGFAQLADALRSCNALQWREAASIPTMSNKCAEATPVLQGRLVSAGVSASEYHGQINSWFGTHVAPILDRTRRQSVLHESCFV